MPTRTAAAGVDRGELVAYLSQHYRMSPATVDDSIGQALARIADSRGISAAELITSDRRLAPELVEAVSYIFDLAHAGEQTRVNQGRYSIWTRIFADPERANHWVVACTPRASRNSKRIGRYTVTSLADAYRLANELAQLDAYRLPHYIPSTLVLMGDDF